MRKSIVWIPVLFVGSMVYWTLAVGLGCLSLVSVAADSIPCRDVLTQTVVGEAPRGAMDSSGGDEIIPTSDTFQSITVKLQDQSQEQLQEQQEVTDQPAGAVSVDLVSDRPTVRDDQTGAIPCDKTEAVDGRDSGRRARFDRGPGETAF